MEQELPMQRTGTATAMMDPPLTVRLQGEKVRLEQRLADVNHALELLRANPSIAEALDAISKLGTRI